MFGQASFHLHCVARADLTFLPVFSRTFASLRAENVFKMIDVTYESLQNDLTLAFTCGVSAVQPATLVKRCLQRNGHSLLVKGHEINLKHPCHVVGFGKAVLQMALAVEQILGEEMKRGIVSVPVGSTCDQDIPSETRIQILEGAPNNLPDERAEKNALTIYKLAQDLDKDDTLLVLISGGGSALLPVPLPPITLSEKLQVIKKLANAGANIFQINCVRKRLSLVKGGGLAEAALPAQIVSLILSDVVGDPLDFIASGPTVPNMDSSSAAWQVVSKLGVQDSIPSSVKQALQSQPLTRSLSEDNVINTLIGNNTIALNEVSTVLSSNGYSSMILSSSIQGNVCDISLFYARLATKICSVMIDRESSSSFHDFLTNSYLCSQLPFNSSFVIWNAINNAAGKKGICVISGGETTVEVSGNGKGGRNQELALRFAEKWNELGENFNDFKVALLSVGTDGIDGPTDAAGAFGHAGQIKCNPNYKKFLTDNDSYTFYSSVNGGDNLIKIGHTGTNVMDIHILVINKSLK